MVGREVMLISALISCALLFLLARRLRLNRAWSGVAVFVFAISPLAVFFHRMVFLDNLATMFILAAFAAAASPRRSVGAALWSAIWFASAALCKETIVISCRHRSGCSSSTPPGVPASGTSACSSCPSVYWWPPTRSSPC